MTDIVPANATALPAAQMHGRIPLPDLHTTEVLEATAVFDHFEDFAADDSGAMEHRLPHDAYEEFLAAFRALITPVSAKLRAAG